jgi:hypothetical protein
MKKIIFTVFLIVPFIVYSQGFKKVFFTILDEYIEREPLRKGFEKDKILLLVSVKEINKAKGDFLIGISMYMYEDYPILDSLKTYNGIKMIVKYPENMEEEFSKHFRSIKDNREKKDEEDISRFESTSNFVFQVNKNNEIYFIITSKHDDKYYYKKLKKRGLKFTKNLKFTKDIYRKQN